MFLGRYGFEGNAAGRQSNRCGLGVLLIALSSHPVGGAIDLPRPDCKAPLRTLRGGGEPSSVAQSTSRARPDSLAQFDGLPVQSIAFEGVQVDAPFSTARTISPRRVGEPLTQENVAKSLRQLFATGLVRDGRGPGPARRRRHCPCIQGNAAHLYRNGHGGRGQEAPQSTPSCNMQAACRQARASRRPSLIRLSIRCVRHWQTTAFTSRSSPTPSLPTPPSNSSISLSTWSPARRPAWARSRLPVNPA